MRFKVFPLKYRCNNWKTNSVEMNEKHNAGKGAYIIHLPATFCCSPSSERPWKGLVIMKRDIILCHLFCCVDSEWLHQFLARSSSSVLLWWILANNIFIRCYLHSNIKQIPNHCSTSYKFFPLNKSPQKHYDLLEVPFISAFSDSDSKTSLVMPFFFVQR